MARLALGDPAPPFELPGVDGRTHSLRRQADLEGSHNTLSLQAVWAMGPHKHETY